MAVSEPSFLVYVVAYKAERHLCGLFDRIPVELFNRSDIQFLVNDDASNDEGPQRLARWVADHHVTNVTIVSNIENQHYGGNQKVGYRVAVDGGFDCVILLHGDGQYAPEMLSEFMRVWIETRPDVVLGSRLHSVRSAAKGGMPFYKIIGNRVLTWFQNRLTGLGLQEYHTGYRAYSTSFLSRIPFEVNSNEFHFDTEILLQAAHVGASIVQIPIPTHYGDEVCRVPGVRYAIDVVLATLQYKMHQLGMLCSLKLRNLSPSRYTDKTAGLYTSHSMALRLLRRSEAKRVLDVGCGPGHVAARCEQLGCDVTGVDRVAPLPGRMLRFFRADLEHDPLPVAPSDYDAVLMLDVIEHFSNPEEFLLRFRNLDDGDPASRPLVLLSTPNVAFATVRLNLALGRFPYAERGILDITHKRLFNRSALLRMLGDCGFDVLRCHPVAVPFETVVGGRCGIVLGWLSAVAARLWPTLFAFQFLVEARPRPGVKQVLANALPIHGTLALRLRPVNGHPSPEGVREMESVGMGLSASLKT